jgi:hypothetical protein
MELRNTNMTTIVIILQFFIEWFELRRFAYKKNPYLVDLTLNSPLLSNIFLSFVPQHVDILWHIPLFTPERDDKITNKIFKQ